MNVLPILNPSCPPDEHEHYIAQPDDALFVQAFEERIAKTIAEFTMIPSGARVLVAVSGGKDSLATLYVLKKLGYAVEAITIDVHIGCYTKKNFENVQLFCSQHAIKLHAFEFRKEYGYSVCYIQTVLQEAGHSFTSCTVCGVLRRRLLNRSARELHANAIATGHNMDDEVQAVLMNWFKNNQELNNRIGATSPAETEEFIPRIKPLYFTPEEDVIRYTKILNFPVHYGRCPCSVTSTRFQIRGFLAELEKMYPHCNENILRFFLAHKKPGVKRITLFACAECGEPCSGGSCRSCQLLALLREASQGKHFVVREVAPLATPELA